jgi:ribosomal protein S18 acetylase RimI-like enzyme
MGYLIVHSLNGRQVDDLMEMYKHTYWASERKKEDVLRMLSDTDYLFGVVDEVSGRLLAFGRVLSDGIFRAVIFDVVVHPEQRGKGLARMILDSITSHEELKLVESLLLYCRPEVIELYEKWGFQDMQPDMHLMKLTNSSDTGR